MTWRDQIRIGRLPARAAIVAWVAAAGCADEPVPPIPEPDPDPVETVEGLFGLVNVVETDEHLSVHAVFARDLPSSGVIDGLAWLGEGDPGDGYWSADEVPEELAPVSALTTDSTWLDDRYYDVGPVVTVGGVEALRTTGVVDPDDNELPGLVYYADDGGHVPAEFEGLAAVGVSWSGGVDVGPGALPNALDRPGELILESHDPGLDHSWYEGTDLELAWQAVPGDEIRVTLLGDRRWYQARLPDQGAFRIPAATLEDAVTDRFEVRLARTTRGETDGGPGAVRTGYARDRQLRFERRGVLTIEPDVISLGTTVDVRVTHHDGLFVEGDVAFDLGAGIEVQSITVPGGEGPVADLTVTVETTAPTGPRDLGAILGGQPWIAVRALTVLLPPSDSCAEPFLLPGTGLYHGRLDGLVDDYSDPSACTGYLAEGPDAVFGVAVEDNEVLEVMMFHAGADAVLYLASDCGEMTDPVACSDSGGLNVAEVLSIAPHTGEGGVYWIVADLFGEPSIGAEDGYTLGAQLFSF